MRVIWSILAPQWGTDMNEKEHGTVQGAVATWSPAGARASRVNQVATAPCTVPNNGDTESSTQNRNHTERGRQTRRTIFSRRSQIARVGSDDALARPSRILLRLPQAPFHRPLRDRLWLGAVQRRSP